MQVGGGEKVTQLKKRLGLSVPRTLYEKLKNKADYQGKTINSLCLEIFWDYFEIQSGNELEIDKKDEIVMADKLYNQIGRASCRERV